MGMPPFVVREYCQSLPGKRNGPAAAAQPALSLFSENVTLTGP
jgi:hypothetical protein